MTKEQFLNGTSFYLPNEILRDEDTTYKYQEEMILKETRNRKGDVILRRYEANVENIKIEVSLDSGRNWVTMLESYPASAGFYEWEVPNYISDSCYIKISDVLNPSSSSTNFKNNPFKIPAPVIILDSLETIYYSKQVLPISWVASGIKKVNIY